MSTTQNTDAGVEAKAPSLEELRAKARELNVAGRTGMDRDALAAAIAAAEAGGGPAEIAEAANATRGDVSQRAITVPPAGGMRRVGARAELDAEADRSPRRAIYRDTNGRRRVVGAGQVIPAGWEHVEDASLADRVRAAEESTPHIVTDKAERGPRD